MSHYYVYFYNVLPVDKYQLICLLKTLTGYVNYMFYREVGDTFWTCVAEFTTRHDFGYNIHLNHGSYRSVVTTKKCHV
jgi:hypothetical protein